MGNDTVRPSQFSSPGEYLNSLNAQADRNKAAELETKHQTGEIIGGGATPTSAEVMLLTPNEKAKILAEGGTISDYKDKYFDKGLTFQHFEYDTEGTFGSSSEEYARAIWGGATSIGRPVGQILDTILKSVGLEEDPEDTTGLSKDDPEYNIKLYDKYLHEYAWKNGIEKGKQIPKSIQDAASKSFYKAMTGWLTAGADEYNQRVRYGEWLGMEPNMQTNPYNPEGTFSNPIWWRQGIAGVLSSATEFGLGAYLTGGLGAVTEKAALNFAEAIGAMKNVESAIRASKLAEGLGTGVRALAANVNEGFSQGLSNKRDRYEELIAKGIDPGTAEAQANSEMNQYLAENLVWMITDFSTFAHIANRGKHAMEGGLKRTWKEAGKDIAKEAGKEAVEEYGQDWMGYDIAKRGNEKLGIKNDEWGILDYTLTQGLESAFWGALGGPIQSGLGKGATTLWNRTVGRKMAEQNKVEEFTKEAPKQPETPKHTMENEDPGTYSEFLSNKYGHTRITKQETDTHEKEGTEIKKGDLVEYESRKKAFEDEYAANKNSVDTWDLYESAKANYDQEKAEHAKKLWEYANAKKLSNIGTKEQTALDLQEAINQDKTLEEDFVNASRNNDTILMQDIENRRFENLFFRYARRGAIRGGKAGLYETLTEMSTDEKATPDQRDVANKFLEKLPDLEKTFIEMYSNPKAAPFIEHAFKIKARINSLGDSLQQANTKVTEAVNNLISDVKNTTDENANPLVVESMSNRKEAAVLQAMEETYKKDKNVTGDVLKLISDRREALTKKAEKLEQELKNTPVEELASKTIIANSEKMEGLNEAIKRRADLAIAHESVKLQKAAIDSGKLYDDLKNSTYNFIAKSIDAAETDEDIDVINDAIRTSPISKKEKKILSKALVEKMNSNEFLKRKAITDIEQTKKINETNKAKLDTLNSEKEKLEKLLRNSNRLLKLSKARNKVEKYKAEIEKSEGKLNEVLDELDYVNDALFETEKRINELKTLHEITDSDLILQQYLDDINNTTSAQKQRLAQELGTSPEAGEAFFDLMDTAENQKNKENKGTPEVILSEGIKDGELSTDVEVVDEEQLRREEQLTTVTYTSNTDGNLTYPSINTNIAEWLENTNHSKVGLKVTISCTDKDLAHFEEAAKTNKELQEYVSVIKSYLSGRKLTESEIGKLPIRMTVLNSSGQPIIFKDNEVFGYLHTSGYYKNLSEQSDKMLEMRKSIIYNLDNKTPLTGTIDYSGKGNYTFDKQIQAKYPLTIVGYKPTLLVSNHEGILFERKKGKGQSVIYENDNGAPYILKNKYAGIMYMSLYAANGDKVPVRLNSRKLNTNEIEALSLATIDLLSSTIRNKITFNSSISEEIKQLGFDGLTYRELFNLAIFEGKDSNYFYIDVKEKKLKLGANEYSFYELTKTPDKGKKIISDHLATMWRSVRSDILNQKMSEFKGTEFKWNGIEVNPEMEYTDLIIKDNVLTTNIRAFANGKQITNTPVEGEKPILFTRPVITLNDYDQWGGKSIPKSNEVQKENIEVEKAIKDEVSKKVEKEQSKSAEEIEKANPEEVVSKESIMKAVAKKRNINRQRDLFRNKLIGIELSKEEQAELNTIDNQKIINLYTLLNNLQNDIPLSKDLESILDKNILDGIVQAGSLTGDYSAFMTSIDLSEIKELENPFIEETPEVKDLESDIELEVAKNVDFSEKPEVQAESDFDFFAATEGEKIQEPKGKSEISSIFGQETIESIELKNAAKENKEEAAKCSGTINNE